MQSKLQNKHVQFQHEWLYIFGKEISLMKRYEEKSEVVPQCHLVKNGQTV